MKQKILIRLSTIALSVIMVMSVLPLNAFAEETEMLSQEIASAVEENSEETTETLKVDSVVEEAEGAEEAVTNEEIAEAVPMLTSDVGWSARNVAYDGTTFGTNGYYNVISRKDYTLVPGAATETEMVLNNSSGSRRQVIHMIEVDPSNSNISIVPGYYGIDKDITNVNNQRAAGVTEVVKYYEDNLGYNVVGAMNTALAYDNNAPYSFLVYNGEVLVDAKNGINNFHSGACQTMLCVYKDENNCCSVELRTFAQGLRGDEWQAIGANFAMVVNDGELVSKNEERTTAAAARSMIGVKEDGTLVLCMNDGRGANNSIGFCNYEIGEAMLSLGCKWAFNCDGGGSSSFVTKRVGEETGTMRCVPCDGAERATLNSVLIVSNVAATGELDRINIKSDYDYFAPGTTYTFGASAIDTHGYAMDLPADISWALSDSSFGVIESGIFTSNGTLGDVDVQVISGGNVVGVKTIHVVNPALLTLSSTSTVLPYSTETKTRQLTLPIVAMIGEAEVYVDTNVFEITSSVAEAGNIDGFVFTATTNESVAGTELTAKYLPTEQVLTYKIDFGKGSVILWDFEDGDISDWVGTDEAEAYLRANGVGTKGNSTWSTAFKTLFEGGQISWSTKTTTFLSTIENGGEVHNGNNALGINFDMRNAEFNNWVYVLVWNIKGNTVLRDVANGETATQLGMWLYVPEGFRSEKNAGSTAWQLTVMKGTDADHLNGTQVHFQYNGKNINALTETDIPENRWIYVTAKLDGDYVRLVDPLNDVFRSPSFIRGYVKPSEAQVLTYYMDDITLDYSSAVDDRNAPIISDATYCVSDTNVGISGQTISANVVSFNASIADYAASNAEGLDYTSAAIYVDGVEVPGVTASGTTMGAENVALTNGTHTITFEIADKAGNLTTLTKTLTVNAPESAVIKISGHNDLNKIPEAGSVYYVDLKAANIETVSSVETTLYLRTANTWELDHMIVAPGFDVSYSANECEPNRVTLNITKTGKSVLTGEQTLVSIPVRVWSFDENTWVGGEESIPPKQMTAMQRYSEYGEPILLIEANVEVGKVTLADTSTATFSGSVNVPTAVTGNKTVAWHEHTVTMLEDKVATATEDGYRDRTYCEICGSVIDWGTTVSAMGHHYEVIDGKFVCVDENCNEVYEAGTGLFEMNDKVYYAIAGNLITGWMQVDDAWYYFGSDYAAYVGDQTVSGRIYHFGENGAITEGQWFTVGDNVYYYVGPSFYHASGTATIYVCSIDGKTYGFNRQGCMITGVYVGTESYGSGNKLYYFDENGILNNDFSCEDGALKFGSDVYYVKDNQLYYKGLIKFEGAYYYIASDLKAVKNGTYYVSKNNDLLSKGYYEFDAEGKLIIKDGISGNYYYENGVPTYAGLIQIDGNYYYACSDGHLAKNGKFYINKNNGLLDKGYYEFDAEGKLIIKDGISGNYYYENGVPTYAGLIQIDGDYYYACSDGHLAKNGKFYINKNNGLLDKGYYEFDAKGKLIIKDGISGNYYYENGVPTYAGLIQIDGDYYYACSDGHLAKNGKFYINKNNGLLNKGYYEFDAEGKLIQ